MPRRAVPVVLVAAAVLLGLTACHPVGDVISPSATKHPVGATKAATPTASPTTSTTASPAPVAVDAASYLLEGTPGKPDANQMWTGHYGFWLDAAHAIACDAYIFSGDSGGVSCAIQPGHQGARTYALPSGVPSTCAFDASNSFQLDGTAIAINQKEFGTSDANPNANVGFAGCLGDTVDATIDAKRTVLPVGSRLDVVDPATNAVDYSCTNDHGVAACHDDRSSFRFSLAEASVHQG
jgi:hypothetical protein